MDPLPMKDLLAGLDKSEQVESQVVHELNSVCYNMNAVETSLAHVANKIIRRLPECQRLNAWDKKTFDADLEQVMTLLDRLSKATQRLEDAGDVLAPYLEGVAQTFEQIFISERAKLYHELLDIGSNVEVINMKLQEHLEHREPFSRLQSMIKQKQRASYMETYKKDL
eukprot:4113252-Amphidinium_carterae.1